VARYSLTAGSNVSASSSFATATITPGAGRLVLAFVLSQKVGGPGMPTASGNGLTWQQVANVTNAGPGNSRITCFRAMGPALGAGPLTFDFAGQQQQACAWSMFEYDNVEGSGANGSGAVAQQQTASGNGTTLAAMLGPLADAAASLVVGGMVLGTDEAVSVGAGLAQIDLQPFGQGGIRGTLQTEDRKGGGSTVDWSWPTTANAGAIALEIKAASVIVPSGPATDAETRWPGGSSRSCSSARTSSSFRRTPSAMSSDARCGARRRRSTPRIPGAAKAGLSRGRRSSTTARSPRLRASRARPWIPRLSSTTRGRSGSSISRAGWMRRACQSRR
jgi:hypothetical protein